ncbi:lipoyl(octanoyl) transferase LipB [Kiloniella sp. b19]|uniref:lipoyl(octanoyl) transferase LipB n=1 Tax=Kiloniella sp. GXU_MW_B19 TaxID=3141326 RepID=UPI0031DCA342
MSDHTSSNDLFSSQSSVKTSYGAIEWCVSDHLIDYDKSLEFMENRAAAIHAGQEQECVWLLEHPPLYTAGTSAKREDLLTPDRFPVYDAGRGGQYTYHGPGQRVGYSMLDLNHRGKDVRKYVADLEEWIIQTLASFNIRGERREGRVGIWIDRGHGREDKIAAIGVRVRKWVTFHGIAINLDPDLDHFEGIVPCGISDHGVTSLHDLGIAVSTEDLDVAMQNAFRKVFCP